MKVKLGSVVRWKSPYDTEAHAGRVLAMDEVSVTVRDGPESVSHIRVPRGLLCDEAPPAAVPGRRPLLHLPRTRRR